MNEKEIPPLLGGLNTGTLPRSGSERLVGYCVGFALLVLRKQHWRDLQQLEIAGYTEHDVAHNTILKLFHGGLEHPIRHIIDKILDYKPSMTTDEEKLVALHELTVFAVRDTVSTLKGEIDPTYHRVRRNLRDALQNNDDFSCIHRFRRERHYYLTRNLDPDLHPSECPIETLLSSISDLGRKAVRQADFLGMARELLTYTESQEFCRDTLELRTLTEAALQLTVALWESDVSFETELSSEIPQFVISDLIEDTVRLMHTSVLSRYAEREIYTDGQIERICDAIRTILTDFMQGDCRKYHEYFLVALPEFGYEDYRSHHRSRFEYLVLKGREELIIQIRHRFNDNR